MRVDQLVGLLVESNGAKASNGSADGDGRGAPAFYVVGQLCAFGEVLGLPARAPMAQSTPDGCSWGSVLSFPLKVGTHASNG